MGNDIKARSHFWKLDLPFVLVSFSTQCIIVCGSTINRNHHHSCLQALSNDVCQGAFKFACYSFSLPTPHHPMSVPASRIKLQLYNYLGIITSTSSSPRKISNKGLSICLELIGIVILPLLRPSTKFSGNPSNSWYMQ